MASKFENMNTGKAATGVAEGGNVFQSVERGKSSYKAQAAATKEEQKTRAAEMRTQGRKGCKEPRINLAFTPANYDYIKTMARATGKNLTEFCNYVFEKYREEHSETYTQAKAFIEALDSKENN